MFLKKKSHKNMISIPINFLMKLSEVRKEMLVFGGSLNSKNSTKQKLRNIWILNTARRSQTMHSFPNNPSKRSKNTGKISQKVTTK